MNNAHPISCKRIAQLRTATICAFALLLAHAGLLTAQDRIQASLQEATAIAEELLRQQQDPLGFALAKVERARQGALEEVRPTGEGDSTIPQRTAAVERYAEAVAGLASRPHARALPALLEAALHQDSAVRFAAMTALREGASANAPNSGALLAARAAVTSDDDLAVRRQAFEAYCRWGEEADVLSLAKSLGRVPGPVRDLAVREWLRIESERNQ